MSNITIVVKWVVIENTVTTQIPVHRQNQIRDTMSDEIKLLIFSTPSVPIISRFGFSRFIVFCYASTFILCLGA
jgi:hypothetical protein